MCCSLLAVDAPDSLAAQCRKQVARWPSLPQAMVVGRLQQRGTLRATLRAWQQRREPRRMATRSITQVRCWCRAWRLEGNADLGGHADGVRYFEPAIRHGPAGVGWRSVMRMTAAYCASASKNTAPRHKSSPLLSQLGQDDQEQELQPTVADQGHELTEGQAGGA